MAASLSRNALVQRPRQLAERMSPIWYVVESAHARERAVIGPLRDLDQFRWATLQCMGFRTAPSSRCGLDNSEPHGDIVSLLTPITSYSQF